MLAPPTRHTAGLQDIPVYHGTHTKLALAADLPRPTRTRITAATVSDIYDGAELCLTAHRPGAADAMALPSRVGKYLYYRDGTVGIAPANAPIPQPTKSYV